MATAGTEIDVSVIIPAYNRLWSLPRAINSCLNAICNTEIIVVDDGSTDGTWEWLQTQKGIVAVRQENQGQTYAINHGVSLAKGKYIRFLDSDDFLTEGIIDKQFNRAIETGAELICSRVDLYEEATGKITQCPDLINWVDFLEIQLGNTYGSHFLGMLFARGLVKQTPRRPDYALREDRMFLLEIGLLNPQMAIVEGNAGYWVQHKHQMQANYNGLKQQTTNWQHINIYKKILAKLEDTQALTPARKKAACDVLWPLATWTAQSHLKEAREIYNWIIELNPGFTIPEKGLKGWLYQSFGFSFAEKLLRTARFIKYGWK